jgi:hypothetical protein
MPDQMSGWYVMGLSLFDLVLDISALRFLEDGNKVLYCSRVVATSYDHHLNSTFAKRLSGFNVEQTV